MNPIQIVPMKTEEEMLGKAYVHFRSWQETYRGLIDQTYLNAMTLAKCEQIARRWPDRVLIAKDGGRVVGFIGYGAYRDGTLADHGEIYSLYVLKKYHGQKVGYNLMNAAVERLSDYSRIALWVLRGNETAIRFYGKYGFCFDGAEQKILLGTPNTEYRMIYRREHGTEV